ACAHGLRFWLPVPIRLLVGCRMPARSLGSRACSFSTCSWLLDYAGPDRNSRLRSRQCCLPDREHTVGARNALFEAQFPACRCLCLRFTRRLAAPGARLEVKMVRYSFLVGLFHPRLHAGLSRRLRSLAVAARFGFRLTFPSRVPSRARQQAASRIV